MRLTDFLKNPRILTRSELNELNEEIDFISKRVEELNDDNYDESVLLDHYGGRLDAIEIILEHSYKLARRKESGLRVICGGAA